MPSLMLISKHPLLHCCLLDPARSKCVASYSRRTCRSLKLSASIPSRSLSASRCFICTPWSSYSISLEHGDPSLTASTPPTFTIHASPSSTTSEDNPPPLLGPPHPMSSPYNFPLANMSRLFALFNQVHFLLRQSVTRVD